ncbi:MAG: BON domain-containing protein [Candidatus Melainabacteria bacterium]|nr:BON domain-containing protein [Candidatus Melainabacteria bacterium]
MKNLDKLLAVVILLSTSAAYADEEKGDNTARNKGHEEKSAVNAQDAGESKSDIQIARDIRKKLVEDSTLSSYAKNAKVIVKKGHVTLKGPVRSNDEVTSLVNKAKECAGEANVASELEVVAK